MTDGARHRLADPDVPVDLPAIIDGFDAAGAHVLRFLAARVPMGVWMITRVLAGRQVVLMARGDGYPVSVGSELPWSESPCRAMVTGQLPTTVPDVAAFAAFADGELGSAVPFGAYLGSPLVAADGQLFGTICGFHPVPLPDTVRDHEPLVQLLAAFLSAELRSDFTLSAARRAVEQARRDADTDVLTGLLNRRGWDRLVTEESARFRRSGDPAMVVVIDLDELKTVNDTFGHLAGDRHLQRAATVLRAAVGDRGTVARLGGDEFAVLLRGTPADRHLVSIALIHRGLRQAGVVASWGWAAARPDGGLTAAWAEADDAMYVQKRRRTARPAGSRGRPSPPTAAGPALRIPAPRQDSAH